MPVEPRPLLLLGREAARDLLRGRTTAVIVGFCLLAVMATHSCTGCFRGTAVVNGEEVDLSRFAGAAALPLIVALCLAVEILAAALAEEALRRPLEAGGAALWLARPIRRETYAAARLAGALAVAAGVAAVLLGAATALLWLRQELDPLPALLAAAACGTGAVVLGSLAMLGSLVLPRVATLALALALLAAATLANTASLLGARPGGLLGLVDRWGPPLFAAVVLPLAEWAPWLPIHGHAVEIAIRLGLWALSGVALLLVVFRRIDLR